MRVPSFWIRNKKTKRKVKVNVSDWASDLGVSRFAGWERVTGEVDDIGGLKPEKPIEKTVHEVRPTVDVVSQPSDPSDKVKEEMRAHVEEPVKRRPGRPRRYTPKAKTEERSAEDSE